ncbi:MAG: flagellar M-ring protein FliF [Treponema sp.]|nr:flagellar M-ring protein FliF [Treponema sp.]
MNEWLKKFTSGLKEKWAKWSLIQKGILIGIVAAVFVAIILLFNVSSKPTTVKVFSTPVTGQLASQIMTVIDNQNITPKPVIDEAGFITVKDEATATRIRAILTRENLTPANEDPFASYYDRGWSTTDADQNVKLAKATEAALRNFIIASSDDVTDAEVHLKLPPDKLFKADQNEVSCAVSLRLAYNSDLATNTRKKKSLVQLILKAVEGLKEDNLAVTDASTLELLNDFEGTDELDRAQLYERQQKIIHKQEIQMAASLLKSLQGIKGEDRIRDVNVKIETDFSKKTIDSTVYKPIEKKPDNPDTPYDDSEYVDYYPISSSTVTREWQGTGFNPMGPTNVEGNNPPVYKDMTNQIGKQIETGVTQNNVINTDIIHQEISPKIDKITVSANVDGIWIKERDKNGKEVINEQGGITRTYQPAPKEELEELANYIQSAIGYDRARGYRVTVTGIQIDRRKEFEEEDDRLRRAKQRTLTIILVLVGFAAVLVVFILYRIISRELERRRRIKADELRRQQELARIMALQEAKEEGMEVTMSVEERRRAELQENAITMAKEHPEDVAMLIRTWLMEE